MFKKNAWLKYDNQKEIFDFAEGYKKFLDESKTERMCVKYSKELAIKNGFKNIDDVKEIKKGDKLYHINKEKNITLFIIGKDMCKDGFNILGAHIDSPRIDIKQNPLYESTEFALLDTHYYGGIKKYQWVCRELALCGVVVKKDLEKVYINIGNDINDPVLGISDLLPHLAQEQMQKTASKVIEGENLDLTIGSIPLKGKDKDAVKENILKLLKDKYNISEEDFISSELEIVPASRSRDYGLDRSMIAGYGHDDRVCAYTSLKALLDINEIPNKTLVVTLVDKEEVGSQGSTGAQSDYFTDLLKEVYYLCNKDANDIAFKKILTKSNMLSSDVSAGVDPLFLSVNELKNSAHLGYGVCFNKYTGSAGKRGCNDADAEYMAYLRKIMDENDIYWQTAELGKVDLGGGGTIAYLLANKNINVIDAGIAVLNMHSPMEIVSKVDVYETYKAYKVFLLN